MYLSVINFKRTLFNKSLHLLIDFRNRFCQEALKTNFALNSTDVVENDKISKMMSVHRKPPNILLYCQSSDFIRLRKTFLEIFNPDRYVVYHVNDDQIEKAPWAENAELLVIKTLKIPQKTKQKFTSFNRDGGNILSFNPDFAHYKYVHENESGDAKVEDKIIKFTEISYKGQVGKLPTLQMDKKANIEENYTTILTENNQPLILERKNKGTLVSSLIDLTLNPDSEVEKEEWRDELKKSNQIRMRILKDVLSDNLNIDCTHEKILPLSPCHILGNSQDVASWMKELETQLKNNELKLNKLTLVFCKDSSLSPSATNDRLPVLTTSVDKGEFDVEKYLTCLQTKKTGKIALFTHVLSSTMNVINGLTNSTQLVAIARRQTQGQGRCGNSWLSPDGCAAFSFPVKFPRDSILGRNPIWLQHLAVLAMVDSVLTKPGYEDLDVWIKWPNDVYVQKSKMKIGGLIVTSTLIDDNFHCVVGCGLNVSNSIPTTCLNDLIHQRNLDSPSGTQLEPLMAEEVIARILNRMEKLVEEFQVAGYERATETYVKRWMHRGCEVNLQDGRKVRLVSLDNLGFLKVELEDKKLVSLDSADWNSFDLMRNLIVRKG